MLKNKQNGWSSWIPFAWCASEEAVGGTEDAHSTVQFDDENKVLSQAEIAAMIHKGTRLAITEELTAEQRQVARELAQIRAERVAAVATIAKFLTANKERAAQVKATRVAAVATIAKFIGSKIDRATQIKAERKEQKFIAKVKGTFDDLIEFRANKQKDAAQEKRTYRIKIAKRVLMFVTGFALLALGTWIVKGFLAAKAAETAAINLAPVAPVLVPGVNLAPDLTAAPGYTPALDTAVRNMPSVPAMPANGLDLAAADRIRAYMGLRA